MNDEEEHQTKLKEKVNEWWYDLDLSYRFEIMELYYPDKSFLMDMGEMWNGLDWNDKWDIYRDNKDEVVDVL